MAGTKVDIVLNTKELTDLRIRLAAALMLANAYIQAIEEVALLGNEQVRELVLVIANRAKEIIDNPDGRNVAMPQ